MPITVRPTTIEDAPALHLIFTSPRVIEGTLQLPLQSLDQVRARLQDTLTNSLIYPLVGSVDGEVVGSLTLVVNGRARRRHVGELGMAIRDDWQGRGVGTALLHAALDLADNWIGLQRVELDVFTDNAAGIALYQKFGFVIEGTRRRFALRNGTYVDAHCMARLRES
jgi:L-phenylalanine/L-methionine N-acetyltransferase